MLAPLWLGEVVEGPLAYKLHHITSVHAVTEADQFQGLAPLGLLNACVSPQGYLLVPGWISETAARPMSHLLRHVPIWLSFADDVLPGNSDGQEAIYCQISGEFGSVWQCSRSLGDNRLPLPPEAEELAPMRWHFDEFDLAPGVHVRRVVYRAPMPRFHPPQPPGPGPRRSSPRGGRNPSAAERTPFPTFLIQCASDTKERDDALAGLKSDMDRGLADLSSQSHDTLAALRKRLLWISLVTFAASMVGRFLPGPVSGCLPLNRLSEAVSRDLRKGLPSAGR